jgi:hypothetical protein
MGQRDGPRKPIRLCVSPPRARAPLICQWVTKATLAGLTRSRPSLAHAVVAVGPSPVSFTGAGVIPNVPALEARSRVVRAHRRVAPVRDPASE